VIRTVPDYRELRSGVTLQLRQETGTRGGHRLRAAVPAQPRIAVKAQVKRLCAEAQCRKRQAEDRYSADQKQPRG
jgi:hypothetical protein